MAETSLLLPFITKEGYQKWVNQNSILIRENNEVIGYQSIMNDVTETNLGEDLIKFLERQLLAEKEEAQFRLQAISTIFL